MALNYASKYENMVDERFRVASVTDAAVNQNYDWTGVQSVRVYSVPTAQMQDYQRDGVLRYGTPDELQNAVRELQVKRDRSFTFTIDRGNYEDTMMVNSAGNALRRQIDEVVIPEIDGYRIAAMACGAANYADGTLTATNAYEALLDADLTLSSAKAAPFGRIAFVSPQYYKLIKLDNAFIRQGDVSQNLAITGAIGMVDNVQIIRVPAGYLPDGIDFVLSHPDAVVAPQKLAEYKIHDNPPGINGWLVEGRVCYDAFVLPQKDTAIYVHQNKIASLQVSSTAAGVGMTKIEAFGAPCDALVYKTAASVTNPTLHDSVATWTKMPSDGVISAVNGHKIVVCIAQNDNAILAGDTIVQAG